MIKNKQLTAHSISYYMKLLLLLIAPLLVFNLISSFFIFSVTREQNIQLLNSTTDVYVTDLNQKIKAIDHFLIWSSVHEPSLKEIRTAKNLYEYGDGLKNFRARVNDFQYSTGPEFQFFIEEFDKQSLINVSPIQMDYPGYKELEQYILYTTQDDTTTFGNDAWKLRLVGETYYFFRTISYEGLAIHSIISVKDMLKPLESVAIGKSGYISLATSDSLQVDLNGLPIDTSDTNTDVFHTLFSLNKEKTRLPFSLEVYIDHYNAFRNVVMAQIVLILSPFLILLVSFIALYFIKRHLLDPIQQFSANLTRLEENNEVLTYENSGIEELESVNDQFKQLVTEIKDLKIDIYEQQLDQQKIEMNYLKLQIKPHFYLNILTTINSMLTTGHYQEAEEMTLITTSYFRYLFQSTSDFVKIDGELSHVKNFLAIQKLRYDAAFDYQLTIEPEIENGEILPLVLQTFVENTIKHSLSFNETALINLTITYVDEDKKWLRIIFTDNGPGFPADVLKKLQQHISLTTDDGKHIGISNVVQRLNLYYAENYAIRFLNQDNGGVFIEVVLPYTVA